MVNYLASLGEGVAFIDYYGTIMLSTLFGN